MGCLYVIEFPNGKRYVGITSKTLDERVAAHVSLARGAGKQKKAVHFALTKYAGQFVVRAILLCDDFVRLKGLEPFAIKFYDSKARGYNLTAGGEGLLDPPEEIRAKIAAAGFGRKDSEETRARKSAALKGKPKAPEVVEAMRRRPGVRWSEERKRAFSEFRRGRKFSPEAINNMRLAALKRWADHRKEMNHAIQN